MILNHIEGDFVKKGEIIMDIFGKNEGSLGQAIPVIEQAVSYSSQKPEANALILEEIR